MVGVIMRLRPVLAHIIRIAPPTQSVIGADFCYNPSAVALLTLNKTLGTGTGIVASIYSTAKYYVTPCESSAADGIYLSLQNILLQQVCRYVTERPPPHSRLQSPPGLRSHRVDMLQSGLGHFKATIYASCFLAQVGESRDFIRLVNDSVLAYSSARNDLTTIQVRTCLTSRYHADSTAAIEDAPLNTLTFPFCLHAPCSFLLQLLGQLSYDVESVAIAVNGTMSTLSCPTFYEGLWAPVSSTTHAMASPYLLRGPLGSVE